jgi:lysosomal acid lipase/cholesteryl ester hydrolase
LVDIKLMLKELPKHTVAKGIQKYEHLDLLWASDVHTLVFPHVLEALETYALPAKAKLEKLGWRGFARGLVENGSLNGTLGSMPPNYSDSERNRRQDMDERRRTEAYEWGVDNNNAQSAEEHLDESEDEDDSAPERFALTPGIGLSPLPTSQQRPQSRISAHVRAPTSTSIRSDASSQEGTVIAKSSSRRIRSPPTRISPQQQQNGRREDEIALPTSPLTAEALSERTERGVKRPSQPEGWWSSTDSAAESDVESMKAVSATPMEEREATLGVRHSSRPIVVDSMGSPARGVRDRSRG